ncbi:hypothetical protein VM1G_05686 [Cytospora mali]|uniref:Enoyl reductase (ER) domain-containing protein n=1 Tax=Cytospora mali TaxID=578113 RepID=A0A194W148_CYTMA|nr:hypothetical protein VM1G_05686 [Valsa mali]
MEPIPTTMRALVAPKYCKPENYEVIELPVPEINAPDEVLIRIHAASIQAGDCTVASGTAKMFMSIPYVPTLSQSRHIHSPLAIFITRFPMILSHEGAGIVVRVGNGVKSLKPGDAVYGIWLKHPMREYWTKQRGWCADYAIATEDLLLQKPPEMSFEDAASILGSTTTALQIITKTMALNPAAFPSRSLEGKTVLVTAGLGAATSIALQVVKNVFGAGEVITTVSTAKVPLLERLLPGVVDRAVDYQTQDMIKEIGKGKVDFLCNSRPDVTSYFPLVEPNNGVIAALVAIPTSKALKDAMGPEVVPFWVGWLLDLAQLWYKWKLRGTNVRMTFISGNPGVREDLERAGEIIATGKVKAVTNVVPFDDLETVKRRCQEVLTLKGGVGKLVIKLV